MKALSLFFAVIVGSSVALATDYNQQLKDLFDSAKTPAVWKTDFLPGAYSGCAEGKSSSAGGGLQKLQMGICTYVEQEEEGGPLFPSSAKVSESPCFSMAANGPNTAYGFKGTLTDGFTSSMAANSVSLAQFDAQGHVFALFRKTADYLVYSRTESRIYGYCWK